MPDCAPVSLDASSPRSTRSPIPIPIPDSRFPRMLPFRTIDISDPRFESEGLRHVTVKSPSLRGRGDLTVWAPAGVDAGGTRGPPARRLRQPLVLGAQGRRASHGEPVDWRGPDPAARVGHAERRLARRWHRLHAAWRRHRLRALDPRRGAGRGCVRRCPLSTHPRRSASPACRWADSAPCGSAPGTPHACGLSRATRR